MEFNILIVDDNKLNLKMLEDFILSLGHSPVLAGDGNAAFDEVKKQQIDLILLDIEMPGMNGLELLKRLKEDNTLRQIPVIMLTGLDDVQNAVESIKLGAEDYLTKPFNFTLLQSRITGSLEKRNAMVKAQRLGQYSIEEKIGEGGMSQVYKANHVMLCRPAAIKILRQENLRENSFILFEREVQITSLLSHPNTIIVYDYGTSMDGSFYYVMEYLPGINLKELVLSEGPLREERVIHIIMQACNSLEEAHQNGLIHCDIKPDNIMLCERGGIYDFVKVLDFGIGKFKDELEREALDNVDNYIAGSPYFLSPETVQRSEKVDKRSDIYSIGAVAYYLLTGKYLFEETNLNKLLLRHIHEKPLPLSSIVPNVSSDLESIVMTCLEKDKDNRPQSAKDLCRMLLKCSMAGKWSQRKAMEQWRIIKEKHKEKFSFTREKRETLFKSFNINLDKKYLLR